VSGEQVVASGVSQFRSETRFAKSWRLHGSAENTMHVRDCLSYRTFVLDLFSHVQFMSDETADMLNLGLSASA
jgi:hypothetical protein